METKKSPKSSGLQSPSWGSATQPPLFVNILNFQAALICSTFFIQNFCWTYLPFMTSGFSFGGELIFFAIMLSSILLYSVDAIVVLIFNSMVRRVAISFFKTETNLAFTSQYRRSIVTSNTDPERRASVSPLAK
jgi:hypothetical protein